MPFNVTENHELSRAEIRGTGTLTDEELLAALDEVYGGEVILDQHLWDFTSVERIEVTTETLVRSVELDRAAAERNPRLRLAIAAGGDLAYGMARMWEAHARDIPFETAIFRTLEEAVEWLESGS